VLRGIKILDDPRIRLMRQFERLVNMGWNRHRKGSVGTVTPLRPNALPLERTSAGCHRGGLATPRLSRGEALQRIAAPSGMESSSRKDDMMW
jgi:hypothetical protein